MSPGFPFLGTYGKSIPKEREACTGMRLVSCYDIRICTSFLCRYSEGFEVLCCTNSYSATVPKSFLGLRD